MKKKKQRIRPQVTQDELWKGVIESMFDDFLYFFFPDFVEQVDFEKPFVFLNKELQELTPASESKNREVDLLAKVFLKNGTEKWLLIHVEVQGYEDQNFPLRMYVYNYRIFDRFNADVMALAIFTDDNPKYRPSYYERRVGNSVVRYDFEIYKLLDHEELEFENSPNPFAIVMQIARSFVRDKPFKTDEDLLSLKLQLFKKLFEKGFERERIRKLANFIKLFISFRDPNYLVIFEKEFDKITKNQKSMELLALIKERTLEEAQRIGRKEGISEGIATAIKKMLSNDFEVEKIAGILEIPVLQVLKVQQEQQIEGYFQEGKTVAEVRQILADAEKKLLLSKRELNERYQKLE